MRIQCRSEAVKYTEFIHALSKNCKKEHRKKTFKKCKFVPVHTTKVHGNRRGTGGSTDLIQNLSARWRCEQHHVSVDLTLGKNLGTHELQSSTLLHSEWW